MYKAFLYVSLILSWTSCMRPVDSDFGYERQGLQDDELLWIIQIPRETALDSADATVYNSAFFEQSMPNLIRDVLNGDLSLYEDFAGSDQLQTIENIQEHLAQFGGSKLDYGPLIQAVELYVVVKSQGGNYSADPQFLRLVWRDPEGQQADRNFGGLRVANLSKPEYGIVLDLLNPQKQDLADFLRKGAYDFFPVYLRTNSREYSIQSEAEAAYVRRRVMAGNFDQIEWLESEINTSGLSKIDLTPEAVLQFGGLYTFTSTSQDSIENRELFLTAENDYLIADWSNRFKIERLSAFSDSAFFSLSGELYHFRRGADSSLQIGFVQGNDTVWGNR
ncbi:MAG: hypothetical protein AAF570_03350 [Bacteroidota bacterium]